MMELKGGYCDFKKKSVWNSINLNVKMNDYLCHNHFHVKSIEILTAVSYFGATKWNAVECNQEEE